MPTPVILDTDIGSDIDDTWALAMLLRSPELDLKLVTSATDDTVYRAKLIARLLEAAGRTDIPIGIGIQQNRDGNRERMNGSVADYDLASFPGTVHEDGVQALVDTLRSATEPMTLIAIGPVTNVARALEIAPEIAPTTRYVGMQGSIRLGHVDKPGPIAEWNVIKDVAAAQKVFRAPWKSATITPLDSCGNIVLTGERYQRLRQSADKALRNVFENYRLWANCQERPEEFVASRSSVLFDTVAVYLAFTRENLVMKRLKLIVDDQGFTREDPAGAPVDVALDWQERDAYYTFLSQRLLGEA